MIDTVATARAGARRQQAGHENAGERRLKRGANVRRGGRFTAARRKEVVQQAARLFLDRGYEQVTIDDIVARIGGSKRTLYSRFGGKAGLFETVIREYCADVKGDLERGVDTRQPLDEQLSRIGKNFLTSILDPKILELHRLMVSIGRNFPEVARMFFQAGPQTAYDIVAAWIRRQQANGAIAPGDPVQLAALFLDMLTGQHQLARLVSAGAWSTPRTVSATVRAATTLFLQGAAPPRK
jgi:AcrR family transcriptional regulator